MTDLNSTVDNMSKEDLGNEYTNLKSQNQTLLKKIDEYEQQLYETKRQLATSKLMEQELTAELEAMQNNGSSETEQLHRKISHLEEEIASLKQANSDNINQLELEISEKDTEIENLRSKINDLSLVTVDRSKEEAVDKLNDELDDLKMKNESLLQDLEEHQFRIKELTKENGRLENKILEISKEVDEVKEFLAIKREELEAVNERFTNVQDELAVTQMELDRCKNVPLDQNKKGNSLFAEVEDNRKILKHKMQQMTKKYSEMKVNYSKKTLELQKIHAAYVSLKSQIEENNSSSDQAQIMKTYEDVIAKLKENIAALQQELLLRKQATEKILNGQQKSNEALIEISRKEVLELRSQMNQQQYLRLASEKSLYDTTTELKRWRQEAKITELENNLLKQKIDDLEFKLSSQTIENQTKANTQDKTKSNTQSKNTSNNVKDEKQDPDVSDIDFSLKLVPPTKFNPEKYKIKPLSKQDISLFCKERTLTVIEKDLLCQSPGQSDTARKYHIPDLSSSNACDFSFETFEDEISLSAPLPENTFTEMKNESPPSNISENANSDNKIEKAIPDEVNNKENDSSISNIVKKKLELANLANKQVTPEETSKMKRKVCFSDETKTEGKPKINPLRGGKILVPKKKIVLASNAAKKNIMH